MIEITYMDNTPPPPIPKPAVEEVTAAAYTEAAELIAKGDIGLAAALLTTASTKLEEAGDIDGSVKMLVFAEEVVNG